MKLHRALLCFVFVINYHAFPMRKNAVGSKAVGSKIVSAIGSANIKIGYRSAIASALAEKIQKKKILVNDARSNAKNLAVTTAGLAYLLYYQDTQLVDYMSLAAQAFITSSALGWHSVALYHAPRLEKLEKELAELENKKS